MKNILLLLLIFTNLSFSQKFDFELIDKLATIEESIIDNYLVQGYGFKKWESESNKNIRVYVRIFNDDINTAIKITVAFENKEPNFIKINIGPGYNINDIKIELISNGFKYLHRESDELSEGLSGAYEYLISSFLVYKKDEMLYAINKESNDVGGNEILVFPN